MKPFNEFVIQNDIRFILENISRIDELLGSMGASIGSMWNGVKSGVQNMQQGYQQGQSNANIQKVSKNVNDLRTGLKGVGFTDPKVHGVLNNISNVLQTGLGNNMKVGSQTVKFNNHPNQQNPNFNSRLQQARNMYANQKMVQGGQGAGI